MTDGGQLTLCLSVTLPAGPSAQLPVRLRAAGLPPTIPVETHANRSVLVTLTARGVLRVHRGYAHAPDAVIDAIATWAGPRTRRALRRQAMRILTAFPVHAHVPAERPRREAGEPEQPGDARVLARLGELFVELNRRHFGAALGPVRFRLSARMRSRLGEFCPAQEGRTAEIRISRRHLRRDGWAGVTETLAHEMVHHWQAETGRRLGHDVEFRAVCRRIGIPGRAVRRRDDLSGAGVGS
jgi:hypothetical protein